MSHRKILLLGANGQVGWELRRSLLPLGDVLTVTRDQCDLANPEQVINLLRESAPDIIVNAAAYTAVDQAEKDTEAATQLNVRLPECLAEFAKSTGTLLVDYSTDYVFDGMQTTPYREDDTPNPANSYGKTKQDGLNAIINSGCRHLVFRVSWVYSTRGKNFMNTILRLAAERDELNVVANQIGAPTPADLIADITAHAIRGIDNGSGQEGIYNLVPNGETSWHGFAVKIVRQALEAGHQLKLRPGNIKPITTAEYPTPAKRPANSRLDTHKLREAFGLELPDWQTPLSRLIREAI